MIELRDEFYINGHPLDWKKNRIGKKPLAVLFFLLIEGESDTDELAQMLWPNSEPKGKTKLEGARGSLAAAKRTLVKFFGDDFILWDRERKRISLNSEKYPHQVRFKTFLHDIEALSSEEVQEALDSHYGDILQAIGRIKGVDAEFTGWVQLETTVLDIQKEQLRKQLKRKEDLRRQLKRKKVVRWETEAQLALDKDDRDKALIRAEEALQEEPDKESLHQLLMKIWARCGLPSRAKQQFQQLTHIWKTKYSVPPSPESKVLLEEIISGKRRWDKKYQPEKIVQQKLTGRDEELSEIRNLLTAENSLRLLTLTGHGGIGKTSIAKSVMQEAFIDFTHGALYIPLEDTRHSEQVFYEIAYGLGMSFTPEERADLPKKIQNHIGQDHLLLILDNLEQVLQDREVPDGLRTLVRNCKNLRILSTSREELGVKEEQVYPLKPLTPDRALELFELSAPPNFILSEQNTSLISEICEYIGYTPLLINMVATTYSPLEKLIEIRNVLSESYISDDPGIPPRQRCIEALLGHSYDYQLKPTQQLLFLLLSIFPGSFSLDALTSIAEESNLFDSYNHLSVKQDIDSLVFKCLVQKEQLDKKGSERYSLYPFVRDYAATKIKHNREKIILCHARFYIQKIEGLNANMPLDALNDFDFESHNIDSAWRWLLKKNKKYFRLLNRYTKALLPILPFRYDVSNQIEILEAVRKSVPLEDRFPINIQLAHAHYILGHDEEVHKIYEESINIPNLTQADMIAQFIMRGWGFHLLDPERAKIDMRTAIVMAESIDFEKLRPTDRSKVIRMLCEAEISAGDQEISENGPSVFAMGRYNKAIGHLLEDFQESSITNTNTNIEKIVNYSNVDTLIRSYLRIGTAYDLQDQKELARNNYQISLALASKLNDERTIALTKWRLGLLEKESGNLIEAAKLMQSLIEYEKKSAHPSPEYDQNVVLFNELQQEMAQTQSGPD